MRKVTIIAIENSREVDEILDNSPLMIVEVAWTY